MQIAIIQFPGSNCERETKLAVKRAGMEPVEFLWNDDKEKLTTFKGYIIVGGFSYEDRSRAGIIAALDPIMDVLKKESEKGKPILGICNGAQILVESGLVPGIEGNKMCMSLTDNKRIKNGQIQGTGYYNTWVNMRLSDGYQLNAFTLKLTPKHILELPVAHAEGRFVIPPALLKEMENNGQLVFQYCDKNGLIQDEFPVNPNGSVKNVAAVSNKSGNVMAMMPHPERTPFCDAIFQSMRNYIEDNITPKVKPLYYAARLLPFKKYQSEQNRFQLITELMITDNQALSVENALRQKSIHAKVRRLTHWEIKCDNATFEKIKLSGVLFNDRKEKMINPNDIAQSKGRTIFIRAKEDLLGVQKQQLLKNHFSMVGVDVLQHSILWQISDATESAFEDIIRTNILFNPYSHDYYDY